MKLNYLLLSLIVFLFGSGLKSQGVLRSDKIAYRTGDTMKITFNCQSGKLKTSCYDQVFAVFSISTSQMTYRREVITQQFLNDSVRMFSWIVPADASYVGVYAKL